ncbi:MAG: hypothetical protein KF866_11285 [Phycisphaeraceae bacterium]|nr:hypothetical protein [Phycisphaeraceae bacterium]
MNMLRNIDSLPRLPLWAQVLVAARILERAALAMAPSGDVSTTLADAYQALQRCARDGGGVSRERACFNRAAALHTRPDVDQSLAACAASVIDAARAAEAALDFPIDSTVTASVRRAIAAIGSDPRISQTQLVILVASDVDQIAFALSEISVGTYDGLTDHVFGRLAPVHALTLVEPRPTPESLAR